MPNTLKMTDIAESVASPTVISMAVPITMTVREAEQVQWQDTGGRYAHLRGTLGELLARRAIYASHLAYMVDRGETPMLREACRVLLLGWLEAAPDTGASVRRGPEVISGSSYSTDQREESIAMAMVYTFAGFFLAILLAVSLGQSALTLVAEGTPWPLVVFGVAFWIVVIGVPAGIWLYRSVRASLRRYRDFYQGQTAEEWFVDELRARLDSRWTIFRNLQLPRRRTDLDVVLVGPAGVWVFEVKGYQLPVHVRNGRWEIHAGKTWKGLDADPLKQVGSNAAALHEFLTRHGTDRYVEKAVVLSEPQAASDLAELRESVWLPFEVEERLTGLRPNKGGPVQQHERESIIAALRKLAQANATSVR